MTLHKYCMPMDHALLMLQASAQDCRFSRPCQALFSSEAKDRRFRTTEVCDTSDLRGAHANQPGEQRIAALQSILTGESESVEKTLEAATHPKAVYQDKTCILFSVSSFRLFAC